MFTTGAIKAQSGNYNISHVSLDPWVGRYNNNNNNNNNNNKQTFQNAQLN